MIALTQSPIDGRPMAIHRTYLDSAGGKKARIFCPATGEEIPSKKSMGSKRGSVVKLFPHHGGTLGLAEGMETSWGAHFLTGGPVWAALDAGNLSGLVLPENIRDVVLFGDNDLPDQSGRRAGQEAVQKAAERYRSEGRNVKVYLAPEEGMDFHDVYIARLKRPQALKAA